MASVIVSGLIVGFLYALFGAGLVIVYRQSRILNFAHGAVGTVAAYAAYALLNAGVGYWPAALLAIAVGTLLSMAVERLVIRRLDGSSDFTIGVATLGIALLIMGLIVLKWTSSALPLPAPLSTSISLTVLGVSIGSTQLLSIGITLVVFIGLYILVERTRFGLALRAASEGPVTAGLLGINVPLVRSASWALAGTLASVAGLLIIPQYQLQPDFLTAFMVTAFAAIVIGGLESIGGALLGGLVFGVGSSLLSFYVTARLTNTVSLVAIVLVLAFFPRGLFGRQLHRVAEPLIGRATGVRAVALPGLPAALRSAGWRIPALAAAGALALLVAFVVAPAYLSTVWLFDLALVLATFPAVLGQNVIGGYAGQATIGQSGFMVVGGYATALLFLHAHLPLLAVLLLAMLVSAAVGVLLTAVTAPLSGVYLALVTISFALAVPELASFEPNLTGGANGLALPAPEIFGVSLLGARNQYLALLVMTLIVGVAIARLARSAPGRRWRAIRDTEAGALSIGIPVRRIKVSVVALGGALAGLGGGLTVSILGFVAPNSFGVWVAIYLLAASVVGGSSSVVGALVGSAFITLVPVTTQAFPEIPQIIFGAAILLAVLFAPNGVANTFRAGRPAGGREPEAPAAPELAQVAR